MRPVLAALPFALLAAQQLHWGTLAWGGLPALAALQLVGVVGYGVAVAGNVARRARIVALGLGACAAAELVFVAAPTFFLPAYPLEARLLELLLLGGLAWMALAAWRGEGPSRGGAWMALAYFAAAGALGLLEGETLLVPGYVLGIAGLALLLARRGAHAERANAAHEGALP